MVICRVYWGYSTRIGRAIIWLYMGWNVSVNSPVPPVSCVSMYVWICWYVCVGTAHDLVIVDYYGCYSHSHRARSTFHTCCTLHVEIRVEMWEPMVFMAHPNRISTAPQCEDNRLNTSCNRWLDGDDEWERMERALFVGQVLQMVRFTTSIQRGSNDFILISVFRLK